tara:strand:+ start:8464 stop:9645 length:1182 start_codon:yes stop_codon:yes gene_type:complete
MIRKKKILIISDRVHALPRMTSLEEEFFKLGNEVYFYSYSNNDDRIHTSSYISNNKLKNLIKKIFNKQKLIFNIISFSKYLFSFPDKYFVRWFLMKQKEIDNIVVKFNPDVIISSSSPVTSHIIARRIAKKFKIKWCADFRDLWSLNHNHPGKIIGKVLDGILEKHIIKQANYIVTVSPLISNQLSHFHDKKVFVITNGYSPEKYLKSPSLEKDKFIIRYTGSLYEEKQKHTCLIFLDALINFKNENVLFEIYSSQIDWIVNEIKVRKLESIVLLKGSMPHKDIPDIQINSSLNIIFGFENYKSYYLKMFEYLGAGRPILLISDEKYKEPTIEIFNKFKYAHVAYNVGGVNKIINQLIKSPSLDLDEKLLDKYKFPYLAKEYLKIINDHNGSR